MVSIQCKQGSQRLSHCSHRSPKTWVGNECTNACKTCLRNEVWAVDTTEKKLLMPFPMMLGQWCCLAGAENQKEKGARALQPQYSTQASAAADGRDLEDECDVEKGLPRASEAERPTKVTGEMKTLSLSQVDAPTLAEFEVSRHAGYEAPASMQTDEALYTCSCKACSQKEVSMNPKALWPSIISVLCTTHEVSSPPRLLV